MAEGKIRAMRVYHFPVEKYAQPLQIEDVLQRSLEVPLAV